MHIGFHFLLLLLLSIFATTPLSEEIGAFETFLAAWVAALGCEEALQVMNSTAIEQSCANFQYFHLIATPTSKGIPFRSASLLI
jgi:hypothetical protein